MTHATNNRSSSRLRRSFDDAPIRPCYCCRCRLCPMSRLQIMPEFLHVAHHAISCLFSCPRCVVPCLAAKTILCHAPAPCCAVPCCGSCRFDLSIHFGLPDEPCRAAILQQYAHQLTEADRDQLAAVTAGFSGRDLRDVCEQVRPIVPFLVPALIAGGVRCVLSMRHCLLPLVPRLP